MRYNAFGCSGLERYSLIPAFLAATISSGSVLVLAAIMGIQVRRYGWKRLILLSLEMICQRGMRFFAGDLHQPKPRHIHQDRFDRISG